MHDRHFSLLHLVLTEMCFFHLFFFLLFRIAHVLNNNSHELVWIRRKKKNYNLSTGSELLYVFCHGFFIILSYTSSPKVKNSNMEISTKADQGCMSMCATQISDVYFYKYQCTLKVSGIIRYIKNDVHFEIDIIFIFNCDRMPNKYHKYMRTAHS